MSNHSVDVLPSRFAPYALGVYGLVLVGLSMVHRLDGLLGALLVCILLAGRKRWVLLWRCLRGVGMFAGGVSLAYVAMLLYQKRWDDHAVHHLALLNGRSLVMVYLGFVFVHRVSLLDALAPWSLLHWVVTLCIGQIEVFRSTFKDFLQAFQSRCITPPTWQDKLHLAQSQSITLLDKALFQATEMTQAMRSRGAFEDTSNTTENQTNPLK